MESDNHLWRWWKVLLIERARSVFNALGLGSVCLQRIATAFEAKGLLKAKELEDQKLAQDFGRRDT